MPRPIIALLLDYEEQGSFSGRPHYALRTAYFDAIWRAGGLPVAVPYIAEALPEFLQMCDGVLTPGGNYPFPARWYGQTDTSQQQHPRFKFETDITKNALQNNLPILGICAGMQVLAGIHGATFHKNLHHVIKTEIDHLNQCPAEQRAHSIDISENTQLRRIIGKNKIDVNTAHNEAIDAVPTGVTVSARAPDGVIEAIEIPSARFAIGVQWHPEFFMDEDSPDFLIVKSFVETAAKKGIFYD